MAARVATPEWSYESGKVVRQLAPFPDSEHAEGVLLTDDSGRIRLVAPGGRVLSTMQMDLPPATNAIPVAFRRGEEPRIFAVDEEGSIYCFRRTGERLWKYSRAGKAGEFRVLTAADLEGQGANEILMSDARGYLYAVDSQGHLRFEVSATDYRISPAAAGPMQGDRHAVLVFGTEDRDFYAVRSSGEVLWHAPLEGSLGRALPILTSLGSGKPVVLVLVGPEGIDALNAQTGEMLWRAPAMMQTYQSIAVADIDGDGAPEVVYGDKSNHLFCVDAYGQPRWTVHLDGRAIFFSPAIADLEGKGRATLFQVVRDAGVNGKSLYALDPDGAIIDSWELPGGGVSAPVLCRWRNDPAVHLLAVGASGKLVAFRVTQNPGAKILWTGLQGGLPGPLPSALGASTNSGRTPVPAASKVVPVSLGTTTLQEPSEGAKLVVFRVVDPDGAIHLTLLKPEAAEAVAGKFIASKPGNYDVTAEWFGSGSTPVRTERTTYRATTTLNLPLPATPGELAAFVKARLSAARQLALESGKVQDYDAAHTEANYDLTLLAAVKKLAPPDSVMVQVVHNPWAQHHPTTLLEEEGISKDGMQARMLGNEYASAALALTNVTARPLTLVLRSTLPDAVQFRDVPMVVPDTTGIPQEDPLPLLGEGQTFRLGPAETRELWLTLHSRSLEPGKHNAAVQIYILERVAPPIEIPLVLNVSRVRLPDRPSYMHCNWLYLEAIKDEQILEATIRDAVEHRTNVFNIPGPSVSARCDGTVAGGDNAAADRLIPRLPGGFFLIRGSVEPQWPAGCSPDRATQDRAYSQALHWYAHHMHELGLSDADYALYMQDEPGLLGGDRAFELYIESVKRVKAADPQMQVFTNPAGGVTPQDVAPLAGLVDAWDPDLALFRLHPAEFTSVFSQAKNFWHYEPPGDQRGLDPLGFYRAKPWIAFQLGMNGGGYWISYGKDYWIPSHELDAGAVYPGPQGPATSKRWEASREGSQDYELLLMLRRAARASSSPDAKAALALIDEAVAFVTRGQENSGTITRHFHTFAPDFQTWMDYRGKLITAAEELIP
jgi:outer membrane protein assembly factor BamB